MSKNEQELQELFDALRQLYDSLHWHFTQGHAVGMDAERLHIARQLIAKYSPDHFRDAKK